MATCIAVGARIQHGGMKRIARNSSTGVSKAADPTISSNITETVTSISLCLSTAFSTVLSTVLPNITPTVAESNTLCTNEMDTLRKKTGLAIGLGLGIPLLGLAITFTMLWLRERRNNSAEQVCMGATVTGPLGWDKFFYFDKHAGDGLEVSSSLQVPPQELGEYLPPEVNAHQPLEVDAHQRHEVDGIWALEMGG
ncbi:MAG: hypothetical protein M1829_003769 [Trizodia sp. TS-e1964]|nr:MAG: hypothetical protein M1829_003769 [Trizodia sp. TS-e1964]